MSGTPKQTGNTCTCLATHEKNIFETVFRRFYLKKAVSTVWALIPCFCFGPLLLTLLALLFIRPTIGDHEAYNDGAAEMDNFTEP